VKRRGSVTETSPTPDPNDAEGDDLARESTRHQGHIGWIVAGTLIGGLLSAILLITLPFAGAPEHIIAGSVLIAFATAWALLAVLSERWTDQPQRWAVAPAILMGVAGLLILVVAPTGNEGGWIWPPTLFALVVWMFIRARRDLESRTRTWMLYPVFVVLALSAIGGLYETYREHVDNGKYAMHGRLIDVGDHKLHISCTGTGSPTVVLEPGLGEPSTAMAWISPAVAKVTRVCVYDRAGRGWSEAANEPEDGVQTATDLHTLLHRAGEQGPFVLGGHSAGGIYALNFAHRYPGEVAGMVLLDSMHPEQYTRISDWKTFYETFRRASAVMPVFNRLGVGRILYRNAYDGLPAVARDEQRAFWSTPRHWRSVRDEFSELRTAMTQAKHTTLGDRPLVVVTAEKDAQGGWMEAQNQLTTLSTNSTHRVLRNASHSMINEDRATAARASSAITDVVHAVRTGAPLTAQTASR
jgi:pimeloyl-ACP methyl ester carboxylesterase